jgi:hypothetical protein
LGRIILTDKSEVQRLHDIRHDKAPVSVEEGWFYIEALKSEDVEVRISAAWVLFRIAYNLGNLIDDAAGILVERLVESNPHARSAYAHLLRQLIVYLQGKPLENVIKALEKGLDDEELGVRKDAAGALARVGGNLSEAQFNKTFAIMLVLLEHKEPHVRDATGLAFHQIAPFLKDSKVSHAISALESAIRKETDANVRKRLDAALVRLKFKR